MKHLFIGLFLIGSIFTISSCEKEDISTNDETNTSDNGGGSGNDGSDDGNDGGDDGNNGGGDGDGTDLSALDFNKLYADDTVRTEFNYFKFAPGFNSTKVNISFSELENEFSSGQDAFSIDINAQGDNYLPSGNSTIFGYQTSILGTEDGEWSFRFCPDDEFPNEVYDCHATETQSFAIVTEGELTLAIDGNTITLSFKDLDIYGTKYSGKFKFTSSEVFENDYAGEWIEGSL